MNPSFPRYSTSTGSASTLADRQREVETALLVQALCGHSPSPTVQGQLRRYVTGELSREQAFAGLYAGMQ